MNRGIFLDRDGVLNQAIVISGLPYSPSCLEEVVFNSSALESVRSLKNLNLIPIIITNQPEISRGNLNIEDAVAINDFVANTLEISHIYMCPHDDSDYCNCRKPKHGLLLKAAEELNLDLEKSFLIGDRSKDITAGNRAGCTSIFLYNGYNEPIPSDACHCVNSLTEATQLLLKILS